MFKVISFLVLSTLVAGQAARAQDDARVGVIERPAEEVTSEKKVYDHALNVSGRVGALGYRDSSSQYTSRIVEGITLNWNVPQTMFNVSNLVLGLESGLMFSHTGPAGSNFFGTNSPAGLNEGGANSFLIPLNVVAGYRVMDNLMISGLIGANAVYRSVSSSMQFGRTSDTNNGSSTEFFPSVGLNAGWELGKSVAIALRGDAIPTPSAVLFTATLGATFPLV